MYVHKTHIRIFSGSLQPLCVSGPLDAYIHACMYVCIHAYMHTCIHTDRHTYLHADRNMYTYVNTYIHTYIHTYVHTSIVCVCVYVYVYIYLCINMYIYTHAQKRPTNTGIPEANKRVAILYVSFDVSFVTRL